MCGRSRSCQVSIAWRHRHGQKWRWSRYLKYIHVVEMSCRCPHTRKKIKRWRRHIRHSEYRLDDSMYDRKTLSNWRNNDVRIFWSHKRTKHKHKHSACACVTGAFWSRKFFSQHDYVAKPTPIAPACLSINAMNNNNDNNRCKVSYERSTLDNWNHHKAKRGQVSKETVSCCSCCWVVATASAPAVLVQSTSKQFNIFFKNGPSPVFACSKDQPAKAIVVILYCGWLLNSCHSCPHLCFPPWKNGDDGSSLFGIWDEWWY
jgi:hypothetical protein